MMRALAIALFSLAAACSRVAGIGDEFRTRDGSVVGDGLTDGPDARVVSQQAYIKASNPGSEDIFGYALVLSADGSTLAVAAPYEDSGARVIDGAQADETRLDSGAVYVFVRSGDTWTQQAYIKSSNSDMQDHFGYALALSDDGNTLLVGAPLEDSSGTGPGGANDNNAENAGAAYVFARSGTTWSQQSYIKASNTQTLDQFGYYVSVSGDGSTIAISAINEDSGIIGNQADNNAPNAGAVYVLTRSGGTWTQQTYLKASNLETLTYFGRSTSLSADGNTLAVGSAQENRATVGINNPSAGTALTSGAAYTFVRSGTAWSQQAYIKASNTEAEDSFGWSVSLSADGNALVVGAPGEDGGVTGVGAIETDNSAPDSGAGYVFARSGTVWTQVAYVKASNADGGDQLGFRVALAPDGNRFAFGSQHEDSAASSVDGNQLDESASSAGAAYVFMRTGGTWGQVHYLKASNPDPDDHFGYIGDGTVMIVGATGEDSAAPGIGGDQSNNSATDSGAVYLFE